MNSAQINYRMLFVTCPCKVLSFHDVAHDLSVQDFDCRLQGLFLYSKLVFIFLYVSGAWKACVCV